MKIGINAVFLNQLHSGGKDQVLFNLLKGFQSLGIAEDIHIFAYDYSREILERLIPDASFTFIPYKASFLKKTMADSLFNTFKLGKLIKRHRIELLFFPHYNTGLKKLKIPTVVVPHDIQAKSNSDKFSLKYQIIYGLQYHFDFKLRTRIVAISDYDKNEITRFYPQYRAKITRIYNPIDTDFIVPAEQPAGNKPYICTINIAFVHKNTLTLIKAFENIMHLIEHDLVLVGRVGQETEFLHDYVIEHRLGNRIKFTGFLDDQELNRVLTGASLYVNPSLFEGFGMTVIEAALRRVPVLSSTTGATLEVTRNLLNYYEPADDHEALSQSMLEVLKTEPHPARLAAIRDEYLAFYAYRQVSQNYYKLFKGMVR